MGRRYNCGDTRETATNVAMEGGRWSDVGAPVVRFRNITNDREWFNRQWNAAIAVITETARLLQARNEATIISWRKGGSHSWWGKERSDISCIRLLAEICVKNNTSSSTSWQQSGKPGSPEGNRADTVHNVLQTLGPEYCAVLGDTPAGRTVSLTEQGN